jgi:hypothetical protein
MLQYQYSNGDKGNKSLLSRLTPSSVGQERKYIAFPISRLAWNQEAKLLLDYTGGA